MNGIFYIICIPINNDDSQSFTPAAYLPSPDSDPAETVEKEQWRNSTIAKMQESLNHIDPRSQDILN